ncbi:ankyrin repeat and protein kinase domain-containing protein 1-like isoform X3 [Neolamprologus brichardi]|uniref:ankyrin repeat and protein kinase domain-containing protein 1-like isoform X3 n=1 Tax=Neolamprologus brichardi TaxID=32507 RepID=UPI0003EC5F11|nr:ankyrin repeat and protein kinase domain-containing protein 1-like isoform X3 [Neolamprologus brichardi]
MELERPKFESVETENLEKWKLIGFGGFGQVFKARHKKWRCDVAIKLPRDADGDIELCEEANHMAQVSFHSSVLRLYGIYSGYPPNGGQKIQLGIVMEFMDRGSVQTLLETLSGPPPYPLAFRLAYEIAQGMNFLHEKGILHHDLKPSNVLLDGDLHAKLADFGLSRVSTSVLMNSKEMSTVKGGTPEYMPPESFDPLYEPVRKFDIYSYGILLWSIICGKKPFPDADPGLVKVRIPKGDRPPCKEIDQTKAEGLRELVGLMERCWDGDPSKRPDFGECDEITKDVFSKHRAGIHHAVGQVMKKLDSQHGNQYPDTCGPPGVNHEMRGQSESNDIVDARTEMQNMQLDHQQSNTSSPSGFTAEMPASNDTLDIPLQNNVSSSARNLTEHEKAAEFVDRNRKTLIQEVSEVLAIAEELGDLVHPEAYSKIRATRTSRDGMRELFDGPLRSGGRRVKAAFFDALKKHHPDLVERLGG